MIAATLCTATCYVRVHHVQQYTRAILPTQHCVIQQKHLMNNAVIWCHLICFTVVSAGSGQISAQAPLAKMPAGKLVYLVYMGHGRMYLHLKGK